MHLNSLARALSYFDHQRGAPTGARGNHVATWPLQWNFFTVVLPLILLHRLGPPIQLTTSTTESTVSSALGIESSKQMDTDSPQEPRIQDSVSGGGTPSPAEAATCAVGEATASFTAASEDAVDSFLAGVLDAEVHNPAPSALLVPADPPPEHPPGSALIEEHRRMLLPLVLENARRREPDTDDDTLAARVRALLTDDWVEEMVKYRQRVQTEMHERGLQVHATDDEDSGVVGAKRSRAVDENDDTARQTKSRRMDDTLDAVTHGAIPDSQNMISESAQESIQSTLDSAVFIMEEHLASSTNTENNSHLAARTVHNHPRELNGTSDLNISATGKPPTVPLPEGTSRGGSQRPLDGHTIHEESMVEPPQSDTISGATKAVEGPSPPGRSTTSNRAIDRSLSSQEGPSTVYSSPLNRVPGLWAVTVGSKFPQIAEVPFAVEEEVASAAQRWAHRRIELDDKLAQVSVHLLCLPTAIVADVNRNLDPAASPADVAVALWNVPTRWPTKGTLIIEMNPGQSNASQAFLPMDLGPSNGPLDLTAHIRAGSNTVRLVQLRDMSDFVFVVHAAMPSPEECKRFAATSADARDWVAFLHRASSRISGALPGQMPMQSAAIATA